MKRNTKWGRALALGLALSMSIGQHTAALAAAPEEEMLSAAADPVEQYVTEALDAKETQTDELDAQLAMTGITEEKEDAWRTSMANLLSSQGGDDARLSAIMSSSSGDSTSDGDYTPRSISASDLTVTRYKQDESNSNTSVGYVKITNNTTASVKKAEADYSDYLYVALVQDVDKIIRGLSQAEESNAYVLGGMSIAPGDTKYLYLAGDDKGKKVGLSNNKDYELLVTRAQWRDYDFGYLGWWRQEGKTEAEPVVTPMERFTLSKNDAKDAVDEVDYKDGAAITLKASVQKNQSIKLTWKKKDTEKNSYTKFALYRINAEGEEFDTSKNLLKKDSATSYVISAAEVAKGHTAPLVFRLDCTSKDGKVSNSFVTPVAPYLLSLQNGYKDPTTNKGGYSFTFTKDYPIEYERYELGMGTTKKEDDYKNIKYENTQLDEVGDWNLSKKLAAPAVSLQYHNADLETEIGKAVYGRVKTVYYIKGKKFTSAASNVLSIKSGPDLCQVLDVAGIRYAPKDNSLNTTRVNKHIQNLYSYYEEAASETESAGSATSEVLSADASAEGADSSENATEEESIYIHTDNTTPSAKSGMIFFAAPQDADLKGFNLLRCDYQNGTYKKVKTYTLKKDLNKTIIPCTLEQVKSDFGKVYALQYTSFKPEQEYYYAVQAISNTKSAVGGYGYGIGATAELDKVQLSLTDTGLGVSTNEITLVWDNDDCAKAYWIYRSETQCKSNDDVKTLLQGKPHAKSSKKGTIKNDKTGEIYTYRYISDKKVVKNKPYYYYIRPIYNTSLANKDAEYNLDKTVMMVGKATVALMTVKKVTVENASFGISKIKFKALKDVEEYDLYRLEVDNSHRYMTEADYPETEYKEDAEGGSYSMKWASSKWEKIATITTNGKAVSKTYEDVIFTPFAVKDKSYFYALQCVDTVDNKKIEAFTASYSTVFKSVPLAPANLKAIRRNNSQGATLTWTVNSKDRMYASDLAFYVEWGSHSEFAGVGNTSYTFRDTTSMSGGSRTYRVYAVYVMPNGSVIEGKKASVTYSKVSRIEIDGSTSISVGGSTTIKATPYAGDDKMDLEVSYDVIEGSSHIDVSRSGDREFNVTGKSSGTAKIKFSCAGHSREVTIRVN